MPPWEALENIASLEGLDDDQLRLLRSRAVAQPFGTYTQPLRLEDPAREALPKVGILCSFSLAQVHEMIAGGLTWACEFVGPEWRYLDYPRVTGRCSPDPMISPRCSSVFHRMRPA